MKTIEKIPPDVLKRVRRVEIATRRVVREVFSGEYHSVFKGQGIEFSEVRDYVPGDDIRSIDWNVTARMGQPFVKKFTEERQLNVVLAVDLSASQNFGGRGRFKGEIAAELAAVLVFSAIRNNDRVSLILFSDRIEAYLPSRKERGFGMRIIREILYAKPEGRETNIAKALEYITRVTRRHSVVFLISDFLDRDFETPLKIAAKKHDLIALELIDPYETSLPPSGLIEIEDSETRERTLLDTSDERLRDEYRRVRLVHRDWIARLLQSCRVDHVKIATDEGYVEPLKRLFRTREKRRML